MRHNGKILKRYAVWLLLLLFIDGLSAVLLWITDAQAFGAVLAVVILTTLLLFTAVFCVVCYHDRKKEAVFLDFVNQPDEYYEETLKKISSEAEQEMISQLGQTLRSRVSEAEQMLTRVSEYEEYVEMWAHETKTPLSLLTLLLDNRREEIPENVAHKLDFVRSRMQESVNQMLFYARLRGVKKDYLFEPVNLELCMKEVLEDYKPLLVEKNIIATCQALDTFVYSDKRGLGFLFSQIISNAIKYSDGEKEAEINIDVAEDKKSKILSVCDNGIGVHACDLPYIFEKGFTGDSEDGRRKATGMGLYLAGVIADDLHISLEAESVYGEGFEMKIGFPVVE